MDEFRDTRMDVGDDMQGFGVFNWCSHPGWLLIFRFRVSTNIQTVISEIACFRIETFSERILRVGLFDPRGLNFRDSRSLNYENAASATYSNNPIHKPHYSHLLDTYSRHPHLTHLRRTPQTREHTIDKMTSFTDLRFKFISR